MIIIYSDINTYFNGNSKTGYLFVSKENFFKPPPIVFDICNFQLLAGLTPQSGVISTCGPVKFC